MFNPLLWEGRNGALCRRYRSVVMSYRTSCQSLKNAVPLHTLVLPRSVRRCLQNVSESEPRNIHFSAFAFTTLASASIHLRLALLICVCSPSLAACFSYSPRLQLHLLFASTPIIVAHISPPPSPSSQNEKPRRAHIVYIHTFSTFLFPHPHPHPPIPIHFRDQFHRLCWTKPTRSCGPRSPRQTVCTACEQFLPRSVGGHDPSSQGNSYYTSFFFSLRQHELRQYFVC